MGKAFQSFQCLSIRRVDLNPAPLLRDMYHTDLLHD